MRKWLLLIGVLSAVPVCAASAEAGWRIDRAMQIAGTVWNHPCAQQGIKVEWPRALESAWADTPDPGGPGGGASPVGSVDEANCIIQLNPHAGHPWPDLCTVILHETGHLAGYRDPTNATDPAHSSNPRSVMYEFFRERTIRHTAKGLVAAWDADPRCAHRGRPFLERHGLLLAG